MTLFRVCTLATLFVLSPLRLAVAGALWDGLSAEQQNQLLAGQQVLVEDPNPTVWLSTLYQWVDSAEVTPFAAAAIFWDLPGQVSYQQPFGLVDLTIVAGERTAAVRALVTSMVASPSGPVPVTYPQENAVFKLGRGHDASYSISWQSTDPNQPSVPGFPGVAGAITFEPMSGGQRGVLIAYRMNAFPVAELLGNTELRALISQQLGAVLQAHVGRFIQGPTLAQIVRLARALYR